MSVNRVTAQQETLCNGSARSTLTDLDRHNSMCQVTYLADQVGHCPTKRRGRYGSRKIGMGFAPTEYMSPVVGAIAQEAIDLLAVFNALRAAFRLKVIYEP